MNLDQVYQQQVRGKTSNVSNLSFGSNFPTFEKDPTINALEQKVLSMFAEIDKQSEPIVEPQPQMVVKVLTPEEAIQELLSLGAKF